MCISANPSAHFAKTVVYAGVATHPLTKQTVHVMGYQNRVKSVVPNTPNALILPIQATHPIMATHMIEYPGNKEALKHYSTEIEKYFLPRSSRSLTKSLGPDSLSRGFEVFDSGIYTVVTAQSAEHLQEALREVPPQKRPVLSPRLLEGLAKAYPGDPIVIACFNSSDFEADPIFLWYEPKNPDLLIAPAIDAHDGGAPQDVGVKRDHVVVFGAPGFGNLDQGISRHWHLSLSYIGTQVKGQGVNGDFVLPLRDKAYVSHTRTFQPQNLKVQKPHGWTA